MEEYFLRKAERRFDSVSFRSRFIMRKCQSSSQNRNVLVITTCLFLSFISLFIWIDGLIPRHTFGEKLCDQAKDIDYIKWVPLSMQSTKWNFDGWNLQQMEMAYSVNEDLGVIPSMDQFDPLLHTLIRRDHLIEPLGRRLPYLLSNPTKDPSMGQGQSIRKLFQNKTNGFFIECGALDGETRSNTLGLERDLQWTGILIEGDPKSIPKILSKGRKAYVVPHCLATKNITMKVSYGSYFNLGRIVDESPGKKDNKVVDVMCLPLFAILKALKVPQVDYFSLDVEGNELDVLKTIPWDEVNILALSVEFSHIGESHTTGSKSELESFMESKGYRVASKVTNGHQLANDFIFAKKGVFDNISIADVIS